MHRGNCKLDRARPYRQGPTLKAEFFKRARKQKLGYKKPLFSKTQKNALLATSARRGSITHHSVRCRKITAVKQMRFAPKLTTNSQIDASTALHLASRPHRTSHLRILSLMHQHLPPPAVPARRHARLERRRAARAPSHLASPALGGGGAIAPSPTPSPVTHTGRGHERCRIARRRKMTCDPGICCIVARVA